MLIAAVIIVIIGHHWCLVIMMVGLMGKRPVGFETDKVGSVLGPP